MKTIHQLRSEFPRAGRVEWIGIAEARMADLIGVNSANLTAGTGIDGEHHAASGKSDREVTIIQQEHLSVIAALTDRKDVTLEFLRRNLAVSGINLLALRDRRFRIGAVLLEGTGKCDPCSRMEQTLGEGGLNAMLGHGGITTRVLEGGVSRVGDSVVAEAK